ncbi:MAG: ABC transporter substrate-binding protein [Alphaproteobacteria bacterium]|nr:ABC transporter substrate-binding protein [Alphaproteobacteria bacterium]MBU0797970.1 ABC transporter substrate-binding protein [Alphaproteobacteria bacterium]MBU0885626.1 ABC transporter substrate-binding protein [Alphaproteobacteria bacterium]MBU1812718.1 ABC transporter substrate-binding protein [Alphaproteobacteria bacterium]MBU2090367.1 ABC transporter substrate-binding protein [Alphaproteobacteria bacterium]
MKRASLLAAAAFFASSIMASAQAAEPLKIGFISTLSGPGAALGIDLVDGFKLGIEHSGGTLGGRAVELITGDDQLKPDVGRQLAERMIQRDKVDLIAGVVFSNVMMAVAKPIFDSKTFMLSLNAGPSDLAGKRCSPYFFNVAWQNDQSHEAMGKHVKDKGYKRVYLMAPNYPAGKDALTGFKRYYSGGEIIGEVYTAINQPDYAAELAQLRAAKPDAVYIFYPGGMGVNFIKQYAQAGLKTEVPLFGPSFSFDETILPATGDAALGVMNTGFWSPDLPNPQNAKFVKAFTAKYSRPPSPFAAQAYDGALLLDSAISAVGGKVSDQDRFRAALRAAKFDSVRGPFAFNNNHFPIQNFYLREVIKDDTGRMTNRLVGTVFARHMDAYHDQCKMK